MEIMRTIKGEKLDEFPFNLNRIDDILYYDGPIMTHFKSDIEEDFIYYWVDYDESFNRWMIYPTIHLDKYYKNEIDHLTMIKENDVVYLVDIDRNVDMNNILKVNIEDIPDDYLPDPNCYYKYV